MKAKRVRALMKVNDTAWARTQLMHRDACTRFRTCNVVGASMGQGRTASLRSRSLGFGLRRSPPAYEAPGATCQVRAATSQVRGATCEVRDLSGALQRAR